MLKIIEIIHGKIFEHEIEPGMILENINPWSSQKYFKVISVGEPKPNGNYYLSCVRSEFPDLFPEFAAAPGRNGDTGFTIQNEDMSDFKLIRLPLNFK